MSLLPALLTAFLFAFSIQCAGRSTRLLGATWANFIRVLIALVLLGLYAHFFGQGWAGPGLVMLLLSGVIGIGVGDLCTFQALRRISPGLTVLIVQCFCAPFAALIEWFWLGTVLTVPQWVGILVILGGMAVALLPGIRIDGDRRAVGLGILLATGGALMQAIGAVLTRDAFALNEAASIQIDGMTAAYQRMCGAVVLMTIVFSIFFLKRGKEEPKPFRKAMPWVVGNALLGLVFGIACFQWALMTLPSAVALSIVALTPLIAMPVAWLLDGERPSLLSMLGGAIAVGGIVILKWV